jgi:hypothetical protein
MRDTAPENSFYKIADHGLGNYSLYCREWDDSRNWTLLASQLTYEEILIKLKFDIEYRSHLKEMDSRSRYFDKRGNPL